MTREKLIYVSNPKSSVRVVTKSQRENCDFAHSLAFYNDFLNEIPSFNNNLSFI